MILILPISFSTFLLFSPATGQSTKKDKEGPNDAENEVIVYDFFENENGVDGIDDLGSDEIIIFPFFSDQDGFTLKQLSKHKRNNHWNFVEIDSDSDLHAMENPHQKEIQTQNFVMKTVIPPTKSVSNAQRGRKIQNNWAVGKTEKVRKPRKLDDEDLKDMAKEGSEISHDVISDRSDFVNIAVNIESIVEEPRTIKLPLRKKMSGFQLFNKKVSLSNDNGKYKRHGRSPRLEGLVLNSSKNSSGGAFKVFKPDELGNNEIPDDIPLISKVFIRGNLHKKNKSLRKKTVSKKSQTTKTTTTEKTTSTTTTTKTTSTSKAELIDTKQEEAAKVVKPVVDTANGRGTNNKRKKKMITKKKPQENNVLQPQRAPYIRGPVRATEYYPGSEPTSKPHELTRWPAKVPDHKLQNNGFRPYYPQQSPIQQKSAALLRQSSIPRPPLPPPPPAHPSPPLPPASSHPPPRQPYLASPLYPQQPPGRTDRGRTPRNINQATKKPATGFLDLWRNSRALLVKRAQQLGVPSPFNLNRPAPPVTHARDIMIQPPPRPQGLPSLPAQPLPLQPLPSHLVPRQDQQIKTPTKPQRKSPFDFLSKLPKLPLDVLNFNTNQQ